MQQNIRSNFDMLQAYEPQLWRLRGSAEQFVEDSNPWAAGFDDPSEGVKP